MTQQQRERIAANWVNGNRTEARKQAKRHSYGEIVEALQINAGMGRAEAHAVAHYLKTGQGYQAACDARQSR